MNFKSSLLAVITATLAASSFAAGISYSRPFAPLDEINARHRICIAQAPKHNDMGCSPKSQCENAQLAFSSDTFACHSGYEVQTDFDYSAPAKASDFPGDDLKSIHLNAIIKTPAQLDVYYQALMYIPVTKDYAMSYEQTKQLKNSLDAHLKTILKNSESKYKSLFGSNKWGPISINTVAEFTKQQVDLIETRRNSLNFMLYSPESFAMYRAAFAKYFKDEGTKLPKLNAAAIQGKALSAYDCQFLNATENFQVIQAKLQFTCPAK